LRLSRKLFIDVRLNGVSIDKPASGSITKSLEMPSATLVFPNRDGRYFQYFKPRDIIDIYVGTEDYPLYPTFTGYVTDASGDEAITMNLISRLSALEKEYIYLDDYTNYDGWEVSAAMQEQLFRSDAAIDVLHKLQGTDPAFFVPSDYRKPDGVTRYQFLKFARDLAYAVSSETGEALTYHLYEHGRRDFKLLKQKPLVTGNEWWHFVYASNLIMSQPSVKTHGMVNRQTVFSKSGEKVVFDLAHPQQRSVFGLHEGQPIKLDYGNEEDAYNRARVECLKNRSPSVTSTISAVDMLEAVPGVSIVRLSKAPNLLAGLHRVMDVRINFGNTLRVDCVLEKAPPVLSREIIAMLTASQ